MSGAPRLAAAAFALALLAGSPVARAYCRTSSCQVGAAHTAAVCNPPSPDDCGTPIAWPTPCAEFSIQQDGSPKLGITAAQLATVVSAAFRTWESAACAAGATPHLVITEGAEAVCHQHEYNQDAGNANVIMFHDTAWPYEGSPNTLALTTVTYDVDSGNIYDADMELNSADNGFTLGDTKVEFDLPSIVTHETGHFQGLAHSHDASATMWPEYVQGTTTLRTLSPDDVAAICATYPPMGAVTNCDPTPRHGFSPLCAADQPAPSSCAVVAPGGGGPNGRRGVVAAALALLALAARPRRRSPVGARS
jgi:hypothetical protein